MTKYLIKVIYKNAKIDDYWMNNLEQYNNFKLRVMNKFNVNSEIEEIRFYNIIDNKLILDTIEKGGKIR